MVSLKPSEASHLLLSKKPQLCLVSKKPQLRLVSKKPQDESTRLVSKKPQRRRCGLCQENAEDGTLRNKEESRQEITRLLAFFLKGTLCLLSLKAQLRLVSKKARDPFFEKRRNTWLSFKAEEASLAFKESTAWFQRNHN